MFKVYDVEVVRPSNFPALCSGVLKFLLSTTAAKCKIKNCSLKVNTQKIIFSRNYCLDLQAGHREPSPGFL